MKRLFIIIGLLLLGTQALWATVTVDGHAYLENQTNHSEIEVFFERTAPSSLTYTVYTNASGSYTADIETGIYDITYSKDNYDSESINGQNLYANTTLPDLTLMEHINFLNVPAQFNLIQAAINYAWDGDTVLVDTGTYVENVNFIGKNITVASLFFTTQDTSYISQTIIDGNENGHVIEFSSGENSAAILSGFTIQNGNAADGGGIYCMGSSPSLENVTISDNSASDYGGGIWCWDSSPSLQNVTISDNSSSKGGGIYCQYASSPSLQNVTISGNSADTYGGGIYCISSNPSLQNVTISGNSASNGGGIFCDYNSNPSLANVTISGNSAGNQGAGIFCWSSSPSLENSIVFNNSGNYGIYVSSGDPTIEYSDFYNNENGNFYNCGYVGVNVMTNANGDSCDAWFNIQEDPLFVEPGNSNYHLTANSPCIDAGDPNSPLDPDGTIADMGAYYFEQTMTIYPTELDFGGVLIGSDSTLSVTLKNYSDSLITIYNVFCSDTVFTTNWTEPTIPAGDSLVIDVTFTPNTTGNKTATLTIENSYLNKTVSLNGNGLGANISSDIYSLDFGAIEPGYPDTLLLEITNDGNINLTIQNIIDAPTNYFNFISITDSTILPDNSSILHIEFDPQVEGLFNDTLFIVSNAYNEGTLAINLSGEGGLTPAPVENLSIEVDSVDAVLNWSPVITTIHGNPLVVDCYLVYYCGTPDSVFYFLGYTTDLYYTHNGVSFFDNQMFYQVTAYVGDMPTLLKILAEHPDIKFGDLDGLVESKKNYFRIRK